MKNKFLILLLFSALTLLFCVSAVAASWQAYLLPDGSICVTDEELDAEAVDELTLGLNETRFIEVRSEQHSFKSSSAYVKVDDDGMLLCGGLGHATIEAYYTGTNAIRLKINVKKAPTSIKLDKSSVSMKPGQSAKLTYTLSRSSAGGVSFYSADEDIVTVNEKGELLAISPGNALVFAETYNGKTASCEVTVKMPPPATIKVQSSFTGHAFESFCMNAQLDGGYQETLSYESTDITVCTVDSDGNVYCLKEGSADITVIASGGNRAVCYVRVQPAASSVTPESSKLFLYEGGSTRIHAETNGGSGNYHIESLNEAIVSAISNDTVRALAAGTAQVKLVAPGGASCVVDITVLPFPEECRLIVEKDLLAAGETTYCSIASEFTAAMPFSLISSDDSIFTVDTNGLITALKPGKATLCAISGALTQEIQIEVVPMAKNITFRESELICGVGDILKTDLIYADGGGEAIYASSDERIAVIDQNGFIHARSEGQVTLTAKLKNNAHAEVSLTVWPAAQNIYSSFDSVTIGEGDALKVDFTFDEGHYSIISWLSEDESLVTSSEGAISSHSGTGSTYVSAVASSGAKKRILVNVISAPCDMNLDTLLITQEGLFTDYVKLSVGDSYDLGIDFEGYTSVTFECMSFDEEIAAVTSSGVISALKAGTARIQVRAYNGYTRQILVEVV